VELRNAQITDSQGGMIFEQKNVEVPKDWSMTATNIVASKYLHGQIGTASARPVSANSFPASPKHSRLGYERRILPHPRRRRHFPRRTRSSVSPPARGFNSPVWFNVGCERVEPNRRHQLALEFHHESSRIRATGYTRPQCSACFINSVKDSLDSILTLAKTEGMLFKWGSGTGTNLSPLRSSTEVLSGGGTASGPLSFMKGFDAFAGVIKSGGKTRAPPRWSS